MATLNLGNIKFDWKGAYAGGTAYVVDDVVSYSGSSYICKLASTGNLPTNGTYWDQMSSAGTDGTDLTSTLTTQGDVLYRDGSGLQRLAAGTSGQVLQTGGSGANVSWVDQAGGHLVSFHYDEDNTNYTTTSGTFGVHGHGISITLTPASAASKFLLLWTGRLGNNMASRRTQHQFTRGGSNIGGNITFEIVGAYSTENNAANSVYDHPNTTSSITYSIEWNANASSDTANIANQRLSIFEFAS